MNALTTYEVRPEDWWEAGKFAGDGYDRMELFGKLGWRAVSSWGKDGWDLGDWPYVMFFCLQHNSSKCDPICTLAGLTGSDFCPTNGTQWAINVEGDTTRYSFPDLDTAYEAIDHLFLAYYKTSHGALPTDRPDDLKGPYLGRVF